MKLLYLLLMQLFLEKNPPNLKIPFRVFFSSGDGHRVLKALVGVPKGGYPFYAQNWKMASDQKCA